LNVRVLVIVAVLAIAGLGYVAWQQTAKKADDTSAEQAPPGDMTVMPPAGTPGVDWTEPERWTREAPSGVRLATYQIPAKDGGDAAQCAVYYFGQGQGGGVEANIERWIGEFQDPPPADRSTLQVNGMSVHRVEVSGTYFAHAMGSSDAATEQRDATLLGAIVEGPNGSLFFKLTGPSTTVSAAEAEFDAMLQSLRPS
jgi:hypothetical protein